MNLIHRFIEFAAAFEKTFVDDDWSHLEGFFTEEAVYEVTGGLPLGGRWEGRAAVLVHLRESLEELDRCFETRQTEIVGAPTVEGETVRFEWRGTYRTQGMPELVFGGVETAEFDGERIRMLVDNMNEGDDAKIQAYLRDHFDVDLG